MKAQYLLHGLLLLTMHDLWGIGSLFLVAGLTSGFEKLDRYFWRCKR